MTQKADLTEADFQMMKSLRGQGYSWREVAAYFEDNFHHVTLLRRYREWSVLEAARTPEDYFERPAKRGLLSRIRGWFR